MANDLDLISTPFANSGTKNTIPESGASEPQNATMEAGFPTITQTPINEGGIPPERADFNGLGYLTTSHLARLNRGLWYEYDAVFSGRIGGYPLNSRIMLDNGDIVQSTIPNNSNNPNSNMSGWIKSNSASNIIDKSGITQQQINDGISSLSELRSLNPKTTGERVYLVSANLGQNQGGGEFVTVQKTGNLSDDGGTLIQSSTPTLLYKRINYIYPDPYMFGAVGDGVTDDYDSLYKLFNHLYNPEVGTTDPNALQNQIPSETYRIPRGCFRYTQPLRLPCRGKIISDGVLNYFARPDVINQKNRATLFYDGDNLEVAALYTPMFKYVNSKWELISDSTEFFTYSAGISTHSMVRGCEYRFNLVTKHKTKIGLNAFGVESGDINVSIGTLGTWANPQNQPSWGDYNPDDLSPKVGITCCTAWNVAFNRIRILAHNQGIYVDGSTGSIVVQEGYINRQVSTAASSVTDGLVYGNNSIIPVAKQGLTAAITTNDADIDFYNVITEGWGCPYIFLAGRYSLFTPHIEGPNDIMMHDFMVYNCKLDIYNWGNTRSMQLRVNTSMIYTMGMASDKGYYVDLHGSSYYRDNSLFNLLDGVAYDQFTNTAFLTVHNVPFYKLAEGFFISDLRLVKKVTTQYLDSTRFPIIMNTARSGMKSLGLGSTNAVQTLADLANSIRILGNQWNGVVSLPNGLTVNADTSFDISAYANRIEFNINSGFSMTVSNRFRINCRNVRFTGNGSLIATSPIIEPLGDTNIEIANATLTGSSAVMRTDSYNGYKHTIRLSNNVNGTAWDGRYVFSTASIVGFVDLLILGSRSATVKGRETTDNNFQSAGAIATNKYFAP